MDYFLAHISEVVAGTLALAVLALAGWVFTLHRKWNRVFRKRRPKEALGEALERIVHLENSLANIEPRVRGVESIGRVAVQKIGFIRFNPFEHTGGDQSFAVALLDYANNGIVLSSLYMREGVRVYAKEIRDGVSKQPLSDEERSVLHQAMEAKHE